MPSSLRIWLFVASAALALAARAATAQVADYGEGGGTQITGSVGVGAVYAPEFSGSDKSEAKPLPVFNLRYGPVFLSTDNGLGIRFDLLGGALELSPAINYRWGRDEGDSELLRGMGDVDGQFVGGAKIVCRLDDVSLGLKAFQGLSDAEGFTLDMRLAYLNRMHDKFHWGLAAEAGFADSQHLQTHYGVTGEQSARSGYRVFSPSGGIKDISFGGAVDYYLTPNVSVDVFARFTRLAGDAADSPIVERGSHNQFATGLLFFYHFGSN
ncbi:MAG: MipA/OmpV family protein [Deltaproteobacteria bacterium]|jgi:outer membrane scaffolding protein for murein synthesis (MipA/OmpV family)|nr:MipA/OmpV family protein [Deltaproteobacteria bacterium]